MSDRVNSFRGFRAKYEIINSKCFACIPDSEQDKPYLVYNFYFNTFKGDKKRILGVCYINEYEKVWKTNVNG